MIRNIFYEELDKAYSRYQLIDKYCFNKKVLDIGCVNHNIDNTFLDGWLHDQIKRSAKELVGIDCLENEINTLRDRGYIVHCADITKPIDINDKYDVIVVGNLIEHLSNFEGFWENMKRLIEDNGIVLISTANPFYIEQYFYSAFKKRIIINPEHTCWMDPVALDQLARRFGFLTKKVYWIKEKWHLDQVICDCDSKQFDMLTGRWNIFPEKCGVFERTISKVLRAISVLYDYRRYKIAVSRHGIDKYDILLYIKAKSWMFSCFWRIYRLMIIKSKINKYELFMSVLEKMNCR